jgi:hypothetical protein
MEEESRKKRKERRKERTMGSGACGTVRSKQAFITEKVIDGEKATATISF